MIYRDMEFLLSPNPNIGILKIRGIKNKKVICRKFSLPNAHKRYVLYGIYFILFILYLLLHIKGRLQWKITCAFC